MPALVGLGGKQAEGGRWLARVALPRREMPRFRVSHSPVFPVVLSSKRPRLDDLPVLALAAICPLAVTLLSFAHPAVCPLACSAQHAGPLMQGPSHRAHPAWRPPAWPDESSGSLAWKVGRQTGCCYIYPPASSLPSRLSSLPSPSQS